MPLVSPTLNLQLPASSSSSAARTASVAPPAAIAPPAKTPDAPSTTVTLSPQAMSALASAGHPSSSSATGEALPVAVPAPAAHAASMYESLKSGISTGVADIGDAIADGAHAVAEGVETTLSTANKVATGILELPFAVVAKGCDAMGGLIDEL